MSIEAITWVSKLRLRPSSVKFVLFAFADCSNEEGLCFPSIDHVCTFTSQDRKTVIGAVAYLQELGYLVDTSERRGRTGQIKVYRLKNPVIGTLQEDQNRNSSESGTVPDFPSNSTVFPRKESRFSRGTVPKTAHGTVMDPSVEPSGNQRGVSAAPTDRSLAVNRIFDHWRTVHEHPKAVLDKKRRALINEALKNYDEQDLKDSITGYKNSPHHSGENDRNTVYDTIELMLRSSKQIDMGLKFFAAPPKGQAPKLTPAQAAWKRATEEAKLEGFRGPESGESLEAYRAAAKRHTDERARRRLAELGANLDGALKQM